MVYNILSVDTGLFGPYNSSMTEARLILLCFLTKMRKMNSWKLLLSWHGEYTNHIQLGDSEYLRILARKSLFHLFCFYFCTIILQGSKYNLVAKSKEQQVNTNIRYWFANWPHNRGQGKIKDRGSYSRLVESSIKRNLHWRLVFVSQY